MLFNNADALSENVELRKLIGKLERVLPCHGVVFISSLNANAVSDVTLVIRL